jgi:type I restriction enzyme, S subunit
VENGEWKMKEENNSQLSILNSPLIPPGYKQTEVGVIPDDWEVKPISQIGTPVRGGSPRPAGDPRYFNGSYIPWLTVAALTNIPTSQLVVSETATCLTEEGSLHSRTLSVGTPIIANSGATLGVAKILGIKCCANDGIAALLNLSTSVSSHYLAHFINTKTSYLRDIVATGNGQPNLNTTLIGDFQIPLPPTKAEQEAIAGALSDADALIESLEQLLTKKRHTKQGAMQELLTGKKRLPGFRAEWKPCQLRDCLLTNPDYGINAPGVPSSGELPVYLRITDIDDDGRFIANNRVAVNHPQSMGYILNENEIVFARTGASVGKTYLYDPADGVIVFAGFLIRAKIDRSKLCPKFFAAFTKTGRYWNWVRIMSMRSGQPGINGNEYASLDLNLPPLPEQTAIAAILSDMDAEIAALEAKLNKTRQLKQGMMQELLTGKIRLIN